MLRIRAFALATAALTLLAGASAAPLCAQTDDPNPRPLIIINGVVLPGMTDADQRTLLHAIAPAIESIEVVKDSRAVQLFGATANDGAVLITLKRDASRARQDTAGNAVRRPGVMVHSTPLIVVDGVVITSANLATLELLEGRDIETIEVIHGVAASQRFGASGAAGVVQITTRRSRMH